MAACPKCGADVSAGSNFCGKCGAAAPTWSTDAINASDLLTARIESILPYGFKLRDLIFILQSVALGLIVFLICYYLVDSAFELSLWQELLIAIAVVILLETTLYTRGVIQLYQYSIVPIIYVAGGIGALALGSTLGVLADRWAKWGTWIAYTGLFVVLLKISPRLSLLLRLMPRDSSKFRAIHDEAEEAQIRQQAELRRLPSHSWYILASCVTGCAMLGSFTTTAIGFFDEIVDPYAPWPIKFGIPIGLSALAGFIIWAGWNFVFLRMRTSTSTVARLLAYSIGVAILVPLTLAIHTVFGIIGVGGNEGLRLHYNWYATVLNGYYAQSENMRQAELKFKPQINNVFEKFQQAAETERKDGSGCGGGEGELFRYYRDRSEDAKRIRTRIGEREKLNPDLRRDLSALYEQIRNPGQSFRYAQSEIDEKFKDLRTRILALENQSILVSIRSFMGELAVVQQDTFFSGWPTCQAKRKDSIASDIRNYLQGLQSTYSQIEEIQRAPIAIPEENRIESVSMIAEGFAGLFWDRSSKSLVQVEREDAEDMPPESDMPSNSGEVLHTEQLGAIPAFVPLRPFWAVVSYAKQLPGYIMLQLALDLSPAVLGLLFALLAPFPSGPTPVRQISGELAQRVRGWISARLIQRRPE